jgi:hypothetical protein
MRIYFVALGISLLIPGLAICQDLAVQKAAVIAHSGDGCPPVPDNDSATASSDGVFYSVKMKNHRMNGSWKSWYQNKSLCDSGDFIKGIPDGEWKHWDAKGQLLAIRHYSAAKFLTIKKEIDLNHPRCAIHSLAALYRQNSEIARQYLEAGYSFGLTAGNDRIPLTKIVENNINGNNYEPVFAVCLHHGLYMNFYADGSLKDSGYYKNGLRDGVWIQRSPDGSCSSGC